MKESLFIELLQMCTGGRACLSKAPSVQEWKIIYEEARKQTVVGFTIKGLERLPEGQRPPQSLLLQWIGTGEIIRQRNILLNKRCVELQELFSRDGIRSCVLKGQGNALMYPEPLMRQSGDIDIWLMPESGMNIKRTVKYLATLCGKERLNVVYHHTELPIWNDVEVEAHWRPSWRSSPRYNRRLQHWFLDKAGNQFGNIVDNTELHIPTWDFNVVYQLQHMYLHVMQEGLGLRQVLDYYYLLTSERRIDDLRSIVDTIKYLGLYKFAGAIMYVLKSALAMDEHYMIVPPNSKRGMFLLEEIMKSGNFGKQDNRNAKLHRMSGISRSLGQLKRKLRFVKDYPEEVLSGVFQVYHIIWRKCQLWRWE